MTDVEKLMKRDGRKLDHKTLEEIRWMAVQRVREEDADVSFWDESGFRADAVHGKTWGLRGQTPVVARLGQRQSISAASAVSAKSEFWFCLYEGALNAELFASLLGRGRMMKCRRTVYLVLDSLAAHKKALVASTEGRLTLNVLPGCAPELNPDEMVGSHVKRTGVARGPLREGEILSEKIVEQLSLLRQMPRLIRSFFHAPFVTYIGDC